MPFTLAQLKQHPFAVYTLNFLKARALVKAEIVRLTALTFDGGLTQQEHLDAGVKATGLISLLGLMDEAHLVYTARIMAADFPPKQGVADRTVELLTKLSEKIVDANRAEVYLRIATNWVNGVTAVVQGSVSVMPEIT